jgi:transcription elongation factor
VCCLYVVTGLLGGMVVTGLLGGMVVTGLLGGMVVTGLLGGMVVTGLLGGMVVTGVSKTPAHDACGFKSCSKQSSQPSTHSSIWMALASEGSERTWSSPQQPSARTQRKNPAQEPSARTQRKNHDLF